MHYCVGILQDPQVVLHKLWLLLSSSASSSSSSSDSEVESAELSKKIDPVINQEDVRCVVEGAAPLEGALPLDLDDKPIRLNPKVRYF